MTTASRSTAALLARVALLAAALALAACGGASSGNGGSGTDATSLSNAPVSVGETGMPGEVDYTCTTDADCAVKDVGNCCGYYPACVSVDSPTFPEQVKAECAKNDMQSVCGFRDIAGCVCVEGRCEAGPATDGEAVR